jgi:hypothetical protein
VLQALNTNSFSELGNLMIQEGLPPLEDVLSLKMFGPKKSMGYRSSHLLKIREVFIQSTPKNRLLTSLQYEGFN